MKQDPFTSPNHNTARRGEGGEGGGLDTQHHVLAIFRSCASIAVRQRIQKEATAKARQFSISFLYMCRRCRLRAGAWLAGADASPHSTSLAQGFPDQFEMVETRSCS